MALGAFVRLIRHHASASRICLDASARARHALRRSSLSAQRQRSPAAASDLDYRGRLVQRMLGSQLSRQSGCALGRNCFPGSVRDDLAATLRLTSARRLDDFLEVVVGCFRNGLASRADFVNDRIGGLHGACSFTNSRGVQITGGSKPARRQIASIRPRIVAFAICVQFQLTR